MKKMRKKIEPLISIIMSTKDTDESMLKMAIDSILLQVYKNFEFIIIVDGSKKDLNIIKQYSDNRIKIIIHEESIGLTKSLNEGLKIARGKYIARMDSDDVALKKRLLYQVKFLEKRKEVDICGTYIEYIGDRKGIQVDVFNKPKEKKAELLIYNQIVHSSVMIRKEFLDKNNLQYNENFRYSQDYELWSRCSKITNIEVISKVCMKYRVHKAQISTAKRNEQNKLCEHIFRRQLDELDIKDEKMIDIIFYLSKKSNNDYSYEELVKAIEEILRKNKESNVYNNSTLQKVLYYRLFVMKYKEIGYKELLHVAIKCKIVNLAIRKIILNIKCL